MVSIKEKQRVARLIEDEYQARRTKAREQPTDNDIVLVAEGLAKDLKLTASINALRKAELQVAELKEKLSNAVQAKFPPEKSRHRHDANCKCVEDWWRLLCDAASKKIIDGRGGKEKAEQLYSEERKLIAAIQIVSDEKQLAAILKKAGLA